MPRWSDTSSGVLAPYYAGFVVAMSSVGYTPRTLAAILMGARKFGRFLATTKMSNVREFQEDHLKRFLEIQPMFIEKKDNRSHGAWGARKMVRYLRETGVVSPPSAPPPPVYAPLLDEWLEFLEHHRGLAPGSLVLYRRYASRFLVSLGADATPLRIHRVTFEQVRAYVTAKGAAMGRADRMGMVGALRMFLRFALSRGYVHVDLEGAVPRIPQFTHEHLPRGPRWAEVLRLPATVVPSAPRASRDLALLHVLITYGVRAGQVASLTLDALDWHGGRLTFPAAKGGKPVEVPLMPEVGNAIVEYIRRGRPGVPWREVFLSGAPPFRPLTTGGMRHVVRNAFRAAGVATSRRGTHAIRHAWATRALAQGQPLKTIADLLGHRSIETTRVYAKVDVGLLREVALPWPQGGCLR